MRPPHGVFGQRIICVHRNSAKVRSLAASVTTASQTCVVRPRCWACAAQRRAPSRTVPRWLLFNSMVVKEAAPSGRCAIVAYPQVVSVRATILAA